MNSRAKGSKGEREVRDILRSYGFEADRDGRQGIGADVKHNIPGVHIEVKRCEVIQLPKWWRQAEEDAARFGRAVPIIAHRRSHEPWKADLLLHDLLHLLKYGVWPDT